MRKRIMSALGLAIVTAVHAQPAFALVDMNLGFAPATILPSASSRARITLQNASSKEVTSLGFDLPLVEGLSAASPQEIVNSCGGSFELKAGPAGTTIATLSSGSIQASKPGESGICTVEFNISAIKKGTYTQIVPENTVYGEEDGVAVTNPTASTSTLSAVIQDIRVEHMFDRTILPATLDVGYRLDFINDNGVAVTDFTGEWDFNDHVMNQYMITKPAPTVNTCGFKVQISEVTNKRPAPNWLPTSKVAISGGRIPPNGRCQLVLGGKNAINPFALPTYSFVAIEPEAIKFTSEQGALGVSINTVGKRHVTGGIEIKYSVTTARVPDVAPRKNTITVDFNNRNGTSLKDFDFPITLPVGTKILTGSSNSCARLIVNDNQAIARVTIGANGYGGFLRACTFDFDVSSPGPGPQSVSSPSTNVQGYELKNASAKWAVEGEVPIVGVAVEFVEKSKDPYDLEVDYWAGDRIPMRYTFTNVTPSPDFKISEIRVSDALEAFAATHWDAGSIIENTCGAEVTYPTPNRISFAKFSLDYGESCFIDVSFQPTNAHFNASSGHGADVKLKNSVFMNDIEVLMADGSQAISLDDSITPVGVHLHSSLKYNYYLKNTQIGEDGITQLVIQYDGGSSMRNRHDNMRTKVTLPGSLVVAPTPNIQNGCGGSVSAPSGGKVIEHSNGRMSTKGYRVETICTITLNVYAGTIPPGSESSAITWNIGHERTATTLNFAGNLVGKAGDDALARLRLPIYHKLSITRAQVATSIEFSQSAINGGQMTRLQITVSNMEAGNIALSEVDIPLDLSTAGLKLYGDADPDFGPGTGTSPSQCFGGRFDHDASGENIIFSGASIGSNASCVLSFNVTGYNGGNRVLELPAHTINSLQGYLNRIPVSATISVGYHLSVNLGFLPRVIAPGQISEYVVRVINSNTEFHTVFGYNGTNDFLTVPIPAGVRPAGPVTTDCPSITSTNLVGSELKIAGGHFAPASHCAIRFNVIGDDFGKFVASIPELAMKTYEDVSNFDAANAALIVAEAPGVRLAASDKPKLVGSYHDLTIEIANPNISSGLRLTDIGLDTIANGVNLGYYGSVSTTCQGLNHQIDTDTGKVNFSAISLSAGQKCTITLSASSDVAGIFPLQMNGAEISSLKYRGDPSNEIALKFADAPVITTSISPGSIYPSQNATLELTIENPNVFALPMGQTLVNFSLPVGSSRLAVANPPNARVSGGCAPLAAASGDLVAGTTALTIAGASDLAAAGKCAWTVDVKSTRNGEYTVVPGSAHFDLGDFAIPNAALSVLSGDPELISTMTQELIYTEPANASIDCGTANKVANAKAVVSGSCMEYVITVTNQATALDYGYEIEAVNELPDTIDIVSVERDTFDSVVANGQRVTGKIAEIEPGETVQYKIRALVR